MLEWAARQKTSLWRDLWSGNLTWLKSSNERTIPPKYPRSATNIKQMCRYCCIPDLSLHYQLSLRTSIKGRRPTSLTPCSGCWSSTPPTWRSSSGRGQRSWRLRNRRPKSCWHKCCHRALTRTNPIITTMRPSARLRLMFSLQVCGRGSESWRHSRTRAFWQRDHLLQRHRGLHHHLSQQRTHRGGRPPQRSLHDLWRYHRQPRCLQGAA